MKNHFFDVNIILDLLLKRQPYFLSVDQIYNALLSAYQKIYLSSSLFHQIDYPVKISFKRAGFSEKKKQFLLNVFYQYVRAVKTPAVDCRGVDIEERLIEAAAKTVSDAIIIPVTGASWPAVP